MVLSLKNAFLAAQTVASHGQAESPTVSKETAGRLAVPVSRGTEKRQSSRPANKSDMRLLEVYLAEDRNRLPRKIESSLSSPPRYNFPQIGESPQRAGLALKMKPVERWAFTGGLEVAWKPVQYSQSILRDSDASLGRLTSLSQDEGGSTRELVMGVDFGTSSTKVVLGDRSLKKAYAIPLTQLVGVSAYLLPTSLYEADGAYSLSPVGTKVNDLKLSLLSNPEDPVRCARVCAYLALVIRATRAWMFTELKEQYLKADIVWSLALGQPADQATSEISKGLFKKLGEVAWYLASESEELTTTLCCDAWGRANSGALDAGDIEVFVMPELAAQIYGFVNSSKFDPRLPNICLMVDVGAGTVDASVFRVVKKDAGTSSFEFLTNAVEAYGAMNLHRYRVDWWQSHLRQRNASEAVIDALENIRIPTEYLGPLPESYANYVNGVSVDFEGGAQSPDQEFFRKVRNQVAGDVLYGTYKKKLLDTASIAGLPFYLCGGGSRYGFYKDLKSEMVKQPNCSWLNAIHTELAKPSNLRADGVHQSDYDRLSVAYGLSQLDLDAVTQVTALEPRVQSMHTSDWTATYAD